MRQGDKASRSPSARAGRSLKTCLTTRALLATGLAPVIALVLPLVLTIVLALVLAPGLAHAAAHRATQSPSAQIAQWHARAIRAYEANQTHEAARWFAKAAGAGDPWARYNLASMRLRDETRVISDAQARAWVAQSAERGIAAAQFSYGLMLELGQGKASGADRAQRLRQANDWFEKAALQGHGEAAMALATAYFIGRGRPMDDVQAAHWYEKAAQAGEVAAQYTLATMYLNGRGVARDPEQALHWFTAAARQGDEAARIQARLINEQLARERAS